MKNKTMALLFLLCLPLLAAAGQPPKGWKKIEDWERLYSYYAHQKVNPEKGGIFMWFPEKPDEEDVIAYGIDVDTERPNSNDPLQLKKFWVR